MGGTYMSRHFSALQCGRIHRALQVSTLRRYAYAENTSMIVHIENNQKINCHRKLYHSIAIDSGATLTVYCHLEMSPSTRIIVQPGGKLVVDRGTITSADSGEMWQGIEVVGDRTKHQTTQNQGVVELKNGAVIENAVTGIRTGLRGDNWYTTGGIIKASDAVFKNNQRAVEFLSYTDTEGSNILDNCSFFKRCVFTIDSNNVLAQNGAQFSNHVTMWDVKNVKFKGCQFENRMLDHNGEGRGIYTIDAGFTVDTCKEITQFISMDDTSGIHIYPSSFCGFATAIEVETTGNQYAILIDSTQFDQNQQAIAIDGNNYVEIVRCDINYVNNASQTYKQQGLTLNNCTGYHVERNTMHSNYNPLSYLGDKKMYGIKASNSGTTVNNLYKNSFTGMVNSILISGNNGNARSGLQLTCNTFVGDDYDIRLLSGATVSLIQGNCLAGADNEFISGSNYNFYNGGIPNITYYYSAPNSYHYPSQYYNITSTSYNVSTNPCYPTIINGGLSRTVDNIRELAEMASSYLYMAAENASQTDETDVNDIFPTYTPEMMALIQEASKLYYKTARDIMFDSQMDLSVLETLHQIASVFSDPYSLSETRFQKDETSDDAYTGIEDESERNNYAAFRSLKSECSSLTVEKGVNWYALSESQIEELMRIAERNTGRSSVMAKGILCFFYGICYEEEEELELAVCQNGGNPAFNEEEGNIISKTIDNQQKMLSGTEMLLVPNPAKQTVTIQFTDHQERIKHISIVNVQGVMVFNTEIPNQNTIDISNLPSGVYAVRVLSQSGKVYSAKLVKE